LVVAEEWAEVSIPQIPGLLSEAMVELEAEEDSIEFEAV